MCEVLLLTCTILLTATQDDQLSLYTTYLLGGLRSVLSLKDVEQAHVVAHLSESDAPLKASSLVSCSISTITCY